jgi:hypothetical protein
VADEDPDPRPIKWAKWVGSIAGAAATVAGLVTGLIVFVRGCSSAGCASAEGAELSKLTVDQSITRGNYLRLHGQPPRNASPKRLREVGKQISFHVTTEGFRQKPLPVRWRVLTAGGNLVSAPALQGQLAFTLTPEKCADKGSRELWAGPTPRGNGSYVVEIQVLDPSGNELDKKRTPSFRGRDQHKIP